MPVWRQVLGVVVWLVLCEGAGALGALFTAPSIPTWYAGLHKPSWTPPGRVFGPVWTTLYALMAVAAWLVWRQAGFGARGALLLFLAQLVLNVGWSALFFGLHRPALAFFEIIVLWLAILASTIAFWPHSLAAGILLLPYLAWV